MGKYAFYLDCTLILLYIYKVATENDIGIFLSVALVILYAIFKLITYVFNKSKINKSIYILISLYCIILGANSVPQLVVFLPINAMQWIKACKLPSSFALIFLLAVFAIPTGHYETIFISWGLSVLYIRVVDYLSKKNNTYKKRIEQLEKHIYKMQIEKQRIAQHEADIIYQTQLEERNKITQQLHDQLGHTLAGNIMQLEAVSYIIDTDTQQAKQLLRKVIDHLREGMESVRTILNQKKVEPSTIGIGKIKELASQTEAKSNITVHIIYNTHISQLSYGMWSVIIDNTREALTNVMKYSQASQCKITFRPLNKLYKVSIKDDGVGCRSPKLGLGITGMEERVQRVDGKLIVDGSDGFQITMLFPLQNRNGEEERGKNAD